MGGVGSEEVDMQGNDARLPGKMRRSNGWSKLRVHYSVQSLASGSELRDAFATKGVSRIFPRLDDAFELVKEMARIADKIRTPTEADPSEYYYLDLHLGNVMVTSIGKITFIDYDSVYMCCNHAYPNAASKCGNLPTCDRSQQAKYHTYTNNFLFFDLVEILTGRWQTSWGQMLNGFPFMDYFTLRHAFFGLLGPQRKDVSQLTPAVTDADAKRFVSQDVKQSYRDKLADLGSIATSIIVAGLKECKDFEPSGPHPMIAWINKALASGSSGSDRRRRSSVRRRRSSTIRRRRSSTTRRRRSSTIRRRRSSTTRRRRSSTIRRRRSSSR